MAEFCLDCWNKLNDTNYPKSAVVLSPELELCEGCGEMKHTIEDFRRGGCLLSLFFLIFE